MAGGIKPLRKLQLGRESVVGTEVAATTIWGGTGTIQDNQEVVFVEEDVGTLQSQGRVYIPKVEGALSLEETPATFEQFPHILEMGIKTDTPAQDGAGTDYIYEYAWPTTAKPTIKTYTIEGGDNQQEEQMLACFATEFTLAGAAGEAWNMSGELVGRQVAAGTYTGAQSRPSVEEMLFQKSKLYIDDTGGTLGATQATNTFISADLSVTTGFHAKYTGDGALYYSYIEAGMPEIVLTVTFEHDAVAVAEKANWRAETAQLIRIKIEGSTVATPGTTYSVKTVLLDLPGTWETFGAIDDNDGNDVVEGTFRVHELSADSQVPMITVVNELSALP